MQLLKEDLELLRPIENKIDNIESILNRIQSNPNNNFTPNNETKKLIEEYANNNLLFAPVKEYSFLSSWRVGRHLKYPSGTYSRWSEEGKDYQVYISKEFLNREEISIEEVVDTFTREILKFEEEMNSASEVEQINRLKEEINNYIKEIEKLPYYHPRILAKVNWYKTQTFTRYIDLEREYKNIKDIVEEERVTYEKKQLNMLTSLKTEVQNWLNGLRSLEYYAEIIKTEVGSVNLNN